MASLFLSAPPPVKQVSVLSSATVNLKPFTNNDPLYNYQGAARRARPLKHYRKGYPSIHEKVKESISSNGMPGLLDNVQDFPGSYITDGIVNTGLPLTTKVFQSVPCCPPTTKLFNPNQSCKNSYKDSTQQYLQSRCSTYDSKVYNFVSPDNISENTYNLKCNQTCPTNICSQTAVYKPSNPQFAVQGAVSSSTRIFRLANPPILNYTNTYPTYFVNPPKKTPCILDANIYA
jgi:hypothetical protein